MFLLSLICDQNLINQGRQKVIEATNALKSILREPVEDTIAKVVSAGNATFVVKRSIINDVTFLSLGCYSFVCGQHV